MIIQDNIELLEPEINSNEYLFNISDGEIIGFIKIRDTQNKFNEVEWQESQIFDEKNQHKGIMSKALLMVFDYFWGKGTKRIYGRAFTNQNISIGLIEKVGLKLEKTFEDKDILIYSIIK
jgi:RimJ/RimL family protein N-acetyltransferase